MTKQIFEFNYQNGIHDWVIATNAEEAKNSIRLYRDFDEEEYVEPIALTQEQLEGRDIWEDEKFICTFEQWLQGGYSAELITDCH